MDRAYQKSPHTSLRTLALCLGLFIACSEAASPAPPPPAFASPPPTPPARARAGVAVVHEAWEVLRLPDPAHPLPAGAPSVAVHPSHTARFVVVFLHGWQGCVRALIARGQARCTDHARPVGNGLGLVDVVAEDTFVVVPQLAFLRRETSAGRFAESAYTEQFLQRLQVPPELPIVLVAHSAGFEPARAILRSTVRNRVRAVVLFDALYRHEEDFRQWALEEPSQRRLISYVLGRGDTRRENERLRARASQAGALGTAIRVIEGQSGHGNLPRRHFQEALALLATGVDHTAP